MTQAGEDGSIDIKTTTELTNAAIGDEIRFRGKRCGERRGRPTRCSTSQQDERHVRKVPGVRSVDEPGGRDLRAGEQIVQVLSEQDALTGDEEGRRASFSCYIR